MLAAIIVALITALAAIAAPLISAVITQHGAYKLASAEWFFREKVKSYKDFLLFADTYLREQSPKNIQALQHASDCALLFSSKDTQAAISCFGQALLAVDLQQASTSSLHQVSELRLHMILAMQKELSAYNTKNQNNHSYSLTNARHDFASQPHPKER